RETPQMIRCWQSTSLTLFTLLALARAASAGAPGSEERLYEAGRCTDGTTCTWDCDARATACTSQGATCGFKPSVRFAAHLRVTLDADGCDPDTGRLTVALAGKKEDGTEFTLPDTTLDYCNVSDSNYFCSGDSKFDVCDSQFDEPRVTAFQCTTFGVFPTSGW